MPRWEASLGWTGFTTDLRFADGREPTMRQHAVSASITRLYRGVWGVQLSGGVSLGGELETADERWRIGPGWLGTIRGSRQWRGSAGLVPAVSTSVALSVSRARIHDDEDDATLLATDLRLGVVAAWNVGPAWSPYLSVRVFGGPVLWLEDDAVETGTDRHHYNAALGSRLHLPGGTSLFIDASLLGEQSLGAGLALAW